ncbi:hypothetical protein NDA16_004816 [Ustilago loliicola]|nr:hypothetical protein NDA16_004816 [Ustilago loliicola]
MSPSHLDLPPSSNPPYPKTPDPRPWSVCIPHLHDGPSHRRHSAHAAPSPITFFNVNSTEFVARDQLEARYHDFSALSQLDRRYSISLRAPSGYRSDWGIDGKRVSYGTASGQYISRSTISGARSVGQTEVNTCATICSRTNRCNFFHPIQMNGGNEGNVICALYTTTQARSAATWTAGPGSSGGTVVASYGFTRVATTAPVTSSASSTRTSATSTTPTTTSATGTSTLPPPPPGATLVQYKGCSSSYTIPMFVNKNFPVSGSTSASTVWIVQHGSGRNSDDYFSSVYNIVGDEGVVIAPNFYSSSDSGKWYQPNKNLAWNSNDWYNGADAVKPSGVSSCSSFDMYDSLVALVRDSSKFPNVNRVFVVAHSAGASMMAKYGMLNSNTGSKYVLANSPSMPYFTKARPDATAAQGCSSYDSWGYGYGSSMPRYVAARNPGGVNAFRNWIAQDITLMTGTYDTYSRDSTGDQSCPVQAQGGQNRRDRGYAWWAYINLFGGTSTDVTQFYGYDQLKQQSVSSLNPSRFGARYCVVPGVAHDNNAMFASDCGRAAIKGASTIPAGPGPVRPA